ncbi:MAG: CAP domain-containing protein [Clostridium sp.]
MMKNKKYKLIITTIMLGTITVGAALLSNKVEVGDKNGNISANTKISENIKRNEIEELNNIDEEKVSDNNNELLDENTQTAVNASVEGTDELIVKGENVQQSNQNNNGITSNNQKPTTPNSGGSNSNTNPEKPVTPPVVNPGTPTEKPQPPVVNPEPPTVTPQPPVTPEPPVVTPPPTQRTWEYQAGMTQELWNVYQAKRASMGLNQLTFDSSYATWTKNHCEEMAASNSAYHIRYPDGESANVVGYSNTIRSASDILNQFFNSAGHKENLTATQLTKGACAVFKDSNGKYFFVIGFDYRKF